MVEGVLGDVSDVQRLLTVGGRLDLDEAAADGRGLDGDAGHKVIEVREPEEPAVRELPADEGDARPVVDRVEQDRPGRAADDRGAGAEHRAGGDDDVPGPHADV